MILWNVERLIKKLVEDDMSSREELVYYLIPFISIGVSLFFNSHDNSALTAGPIYNFFFRVGVVVLIFFIHRKYFSRNFLKSLFSLSSIAMIKITVLTTGVGLLLVLLGAGVSLLAGDIRYSEFIGSLLPYGRVISFHLVAFLTVRYFFALNKRAQETSFRT